MNKVERVIRYEINEIVGGYEVEFDNKVINKGEITLNDVVDTIYMIMTSGDNKYIKIPSRGGCELIEKKHWKFLGKEKLKNYIMMLCIEDLREGGDWTFLA